MLTSLLGILMIDNSEINVNATTDDVTTGGVKLQTEVSRDTKNYLRLEAVRRQLTMGQLIDEIVRMFCQQDVPKSTS
jgi:hypothetical protein